MCNLEYASAVPDLPAVLRAAVAAAGSGRRPADPCVRITEPGSRAGAAVAESEYVGRGMGPRSARKAAAAAALPPAGVGDGDERVEWRQGRAYNISYVTKVAPPEAPRRQRVIFVPGSCQYTDLRWLL